MGKRTNYVGCMAIGGRLKYVALAAPSRAAARAWLREHLPAARLRTLFLHRKDMKRRGRQPCPCCGDTGCGVCGGAPEVNKDRPQ